LQVGGGLDLTGCTGLTALPDNFSCRSLYLDPEHFNNIAYRQRCGYHDRTIFAVWTKNNFQIAAGCFFGPIDVFESRVDAKYSGDAAKAYKRAAQECIAELTEKLNKSGI
ncbi:hypothetical protein J8655_00005, partial [Dickeya oryzae]|uniref:hypothetical protein n=1 Tax=Dickeya oryzae TaxID=1240404 RepID=UPI001AECAB2A